MTVDELLRIATYASRRAIERERADCIQEAIVEMLAHPGRHPIRAGENGARRWLHRERRQHRHRIGRPNERDRVVQPPDPVPSLDLETMLATLTPRHAAILIASAARSQSSSRHPGAAPWSSKEANLALRARAKVRAAFPHYQE